MKNLFKISVFSFLLFGSLNVYAENEKMIHTNTFDAVMYQTKNGSLRINVNKHDYLKMNITIKNKNGEIIQSDFVERNVNKFAINYNCSALEEGEYTVQIGNRHDVQLKSFRIVKQQEEIKRIGLINTIRLD